ncbi:hypothetical protein HXX76_000099 [Chlamydomonas incerta]|uniref:Cyclic nucleotide-binding domain-containing protein n=1 Tax=Chlamydomonas incerta TaxID=51695 RepID=A0A835WDQ5_CHLIN|nr:hypothetical protein HXX76_000099 [Chlamydomonas incerta]|eukprot:KAG2445483.1 hypothetical protein HXX76_000099 [Chlamydomonas incerta]
MPTAKEQAALLAATANSDAISAQQDKAAAQVAAQRAAAAAAAQRAEFQYLAGIPATRRTVAQNNRLAVFLASAPRTASAGPTAIHALSTAVQVVEVPRNGTVYRLNDPSDGFYVVVDGRVVLYDVKDREEAEDDDGVVDRLGRNESFGEEDLLSGSRRAHRAEAGPEASAILLRVSPELYRKHLQHLHQPDFEDKVEFLGRLEVFRALPDDTLRKLAPCFGQVELRAKDYLVRQGERADSMFAIAAGQCSVLVDPKFRPEASGLAEADPKKAMQVCLIGPGNIVGDMTVLANVRKRTASILCLTDLVTYKIRRATFIRRVPPMQLEALRQVAEAKIKITEKRVTAAAGGGGATKTSGPPVLLTLRDKILHGHDLRQLSQPQGVGPLDLRGHGPGGLSSGVEALLANSLAAAQHAAGQQQHSASGSVQGAAAAAAFSAAGIIPGGAARAAAAAGGGSGGGGSPAGGGGPQSPLAAAAAALVAASGGGPIGMGAGPGGLHNARARFSAPPRKATSMPAAALGGAGASSVSASGGVAAVGGRVGRGPAALPGGIRGTPDINYTWGLGPGTLINSLLAAGSNGSDGDGGGGGRPSTASPGGPGMGVRRSQPIDGRASPSAEGAAAGGGGGGGNISTAHLGHHASVVPGVGGTHAPAYHGGAAGALTPSPLPATNHHLTRGGGGGGGVGGAASFSHAGRPGAGSPAGMPGRAGSNSVMLPQPGTSQAIRTLPGAIADGYTPYNAWAAGAGGPELAITGGGSSSSPLGRGGSMARVADRLGGGTASPLGGVERLGSLTGMGGAAAAASAAASAAAAAAAAGRSDPRRSFSGIGATSLLRPLVIGAAAPAHFNSMNARASEPSGGAGGLLAADVTAAAAAAAAAEAAAAAAGPRAGAGAGSSRRSISLSGGPGRVSGGDASGSPRRAVWASDAELLQDQQRYSEAAAAAAVEEADAEAAGGEGGEGGERSGPGRQLTKKKSMGKARFGRMLVTANSSVDALVAEAVLAAEAAEVAAEAAEAAEAAAAAAAAAAAGTAAAAAGPQGAAAEGEAVAAGTAGAAGAAGAEGAGAEGADADASAPGLGPAAQPEAEGPAGAAADAEAPAAVAAESAEAPDATAEGAVAAQEGAAAVGDEAGALAAPAPAEGGEAPTADDAAAASPGDAGFDASQPDGAATGADGAATDVGEEAPRTQSPAGGLAVEHSTDSAAPSRENSSRLVTARLQHQQLQHQHQQQQQQLQPPPSPEPQQQLAVAATLAAAQQSSRGSFSGVTPAQLPAWGGPAAAGAAAPGPAAAPPPPALTIVATPAPVAVRSASPAVSSPSAATMAAAPRPASRQPVTLQLTVPDGAGGGAGGGYGRSGGANAASPNRRFQGGGAGGAAAVSPGHVRQYPFVGPFLSITKGVAPGLGGLGAGSPTGANLPPRQASLTAASPPSFTGNPAPMYDSVRVVHGTEGGVAGAGGGASPSRGGGGGGGGGGGTLRKGGSLYSKPAPVQRAVMP